MPGVEHANEAAWFFLPVGFGFVVRWCVNVWIAGISADLGMSVFYCSLIDWFNK